MTIPIAIGIVFNLLDTWQTQFFMQKDGVHREANPFIRWLVGRFGFPGLWFVKALVVNAVAAIWFTGFRYDTQWLFAIAFVWIVGWNAGVQHGLHADVDR